MRLHFSARAFVLFMALIFIPAITLAGEKNLYERLGGKESIAKVVDQFVSNVLADPTIQPFFAITVNEAGRADRLKGRLVEQICQVTGGPCTYSGRDMKSAHKGMAITDAHFDGLVRALSAALDHLSVPAKEKGELLNILGPLRAAIVEKK